MSEQMQVLVAPSCQTPGHHTALHRAAMVGNGDAMAALVQGGCAMDLQDRDGNTALHEVAWHGFSQCVKLLVKAGAEIHVKNKELNQWKYRDENGTEHLVSVWAGNTALHLACQNAHAQTARILLLGGARPDTKNNMGDTCLHVAARYSNLALVKILLNSLCSVTETNQAGDTALHVAAALNHKKTVQLLLEAGTDGNARNNAGKTALDKARDNNHKDVAHLLARAPQVLRFTRGRTIRKRRERLKAERRTQSVTRLEILPKKDSSSAVEETPSSEQVLSSAAIIKTSLHHHNHKALAATSSPHSHHRRRRLRDLALDEDCLRGSENKFHRKKDLLYWDGEFPPSQNGKTYQLYTLYRDKDGNIRQAPANGCHCKPLIKKLEGQLKANQDEMRLKIQNVQEKVNCRLGKMDRRNRHQIKVLDILNQERVAAERKDMIYRIEQRAAQGREEAQMRQAAASCELKKWCMSQLQDMDLQIPTKPQYFKLLPSPSVDQSLADGDLESLPLLSVLSGDSNSSLATYVNVLPFPSSYNPSGPDQERTASGKYFQVKVERSPDDYENTALSPLPAQLPSGLLLDSADPYWQPPGGQDSPTAVVALSGEGCSSCASSYQSQSSKRKPRRVQHQEHSYNRQQRKHPREPAGTRGRAGMPANSARILEFFTDRPPEPTFSQERNNLHAVEVTQRFFETVSTQLERWYERKILEAKQQTELRAQQDRERLLQRISSLEEEIQRLKANGTQKVDEKP